MTNSIFLARLIGPPALVIGIALLLRAGFAQMAEEFLRSPALMFLAGIITLPAGLAVVLSHNVWAADWRTLITVLGWLAVVSGAVRILWPDRTAALGRRLLRQPLALRLGAAIYIAVGLTLCLFGFGR
jgi:hypothetical protein